MYQKKSRFLQINESGRVVGGLFIALVVGGYALHSMHEDEIRERQRKELARKTVVQTPTELDKLPPLPAGEEKRRHLLGAECVQGVYYTMFRYREIPMVDPNGKAKLCNQRGSLTYQDYFGDYDLRCINEVLYLNQTLSRRYGGGPVALYDSETGLPKSCDLRD
ncbi:hypothetical protein HC752_23540 [Vibrio sp. S9_S30]|uniref:hypothetical protein n=1 Tax=Vibrio sp. S9_S30 TaxID=2720226 RepID=UPI001680867F|nr:hypothetical protein [Vibrio sp. S9_S30]MBD1559901.1 hypothetical protein [Vibrio sp. S9_S30]